MKHALREDSESNDAGYRGEVDLSGRLLALGGRTLRHRTMPALSQKRTIVTNATLHPFERVGNLSQFTDFRF